MTHIDIGIEGIYLGYKEGNYYLPRENLKSVNVWRTVRGAVHSLQIFSLDRAPLLIVGFHSMEGLMEAINKRYPEVPLNTRSLYINWHNPYVPSLFILGLASALLLLAVVGGEEVLDFSITCGRFGLALFFIISLPFSRINPRVLWLDIYLGIFFFCRALVFLYL